MKNFNTKILAVGLSAVMLTSAIAACKTANTDADPAATSAATDATAPEGGAATLGGWKIPDSIAVTADEQAAFDKAIAAEKDYAYKPVFILASQVVAGTNYCFLSESTTGAKSYTLTYINVDPSGEAKLIKDDRIVLPGTENGEQLAGGWTYAESPEISLDLDEVLNKATDEKLGMDYVAIALIGSQVVSGTNYAVLYKVTPLTENAESTYQIVYIYEDLQGNATVSENVGIDIGV